MAEPRHRAIITINREDLLDLFQGRARIGGFPVDAQLVGVHYEFTRDAMVLMLEHPSFPEVYPGEMAMVISHTMTRGFEPHIFASLEDLLQ